MNSPTSLYFPMVYAAGAALALCGGVFALLLREAAIPGTAAAMIGIGVVVATMFAQVNARRQRTDQPE